MFRFTIETIQMLIPMLKTRKEALGKYPPVICEYFKQLFSQVTSPHSACPSTNSERGRRQDSSVHSH